jgi:hypothetical protein
MIHMSEEMVLIGVFSSAAEAAIVRGRLMENGIETMVAMDDAGGMIPSLQLAAGVRLFVHAKDAEQAQALLETDWSDSEEG